MQASRTSILVVRRMLGSGLIGPVPLMGPQGSLGTNWFGVKEEPPIQISLDGEKIGTIEGPKHSRDFLSFMAEGLPEPTKERFEIQAGHHNLILDVSRFQGLLYSHTIFGAAPGIQSFDIAPGETVTFLCHYCPSRRGFGHVIRLLREPSPQQIEHPIQTVGPSGAVVVPAAAMIIINPRMASAIDSNYNATQLSTSFSVGNEIHVTFGLYLGGKIGYVDAKWYADGEFFTQNKLALDDPFFDHGQFRVVYHRAANGTVELYWCTSSDRSDAQLARIVTFTVV